jgi:hypothetical protein
VLWWVVLLLGMLGLLFAGPLFFAIAGAPPSPRPVVPVAAGAAAGFDFASCTPLGPPDNLVCDYGPQFNAAGKESGIDPRLLAALAAVGSGFDPAVVSCRQPVAGDGPLGLMHVRPSAIPAGGFDPCDPHAAVPGAAAQLREAHDQLGSWEEALAAHVLGVEAVRAAGAVPQDGTTEGFVADVMATWARYQQLFAGSLAACPLAGAPGPTEAYADVRTTRATQEMSAAVTTCFGREHPIYCYDRRTRSDGREGPYEHPRGRACDFMITPGGSAGHDDEQHGRAMAEWVAANADELDVLYVIWFNKSWDAGDGYLPWSEWRTYDPDCVGGCDPSHGHFNHVHVSVELLPGDPPSAECPFPDCTE